MTYRKYGINPKLISLVTGQDLSEIPASPTGSKLPGKYGKMVYKRLDDLPATGRKHKLTCSSCKKTSQYDLGLIVMDPSTFMDKAKSADRMKSEMEEYQFTGYFRCYHCNSAGTWEIPSETKDNLRIQVMASLFMEKTDTNSLGVKFGKFIVSGGESFPWGTDTEDFYLDKLRSNPDDAWLWNRLGNTYSTGTRPDLAVVAYEESIKFDPHQMESLFSLGKTLYEIGEPALAVPLLRQVLMAARNYSHLAPLDLRDMLAQTLFIILDIVGDLEELMKNIPMANDFPDYKESTAQPRDLQFLNLTLTLNESSGLYPLAEIYMGKQKDALPVAAQTLKSPVIHPLKRKPPKKKRKRKK